MKYIRTKDRVFETHRLPLERFSIELTKLIDKQVGLPNPHIEEIEIIKQADTIEELCDGFIITSKQGHIYDSYGDYNYELKKVLPQAREECPDEDWDLYGCILVNGIIKQVAKMNEKGELELL